MPVQGTLADAQALDLGAVCVGNNPAKEIIGSTRDIGNPVADQTTCAGFGNRQGQTALAEDPANLKFNRLIVHNLIIYWFPVFIPHNC